MPSPSSRPSGKAAPSPSLCLSEEDVERLLVEETPDVRIDVLRKVAADHGTQRYSVRELAIAEQILRVLVRDTEISVRETLSLALKDNPNIPRDIILALSRDHDSVALPILESSSVLTDQDLIALVKSARASAKVSAVARRKALSEEVTAAVLETRHAPAVTQLMKNPAAPISADAYHGILRDHSQNQEIMAAVAVRPNLPVTVVEKVITLVSDTLAKTLRTQYGIAGATIAAETEKTRELATLRLVDSQISPRDVEKLIDQLQVFGRLSPSMILTSLCRGNLYFFETSLARLSNIPVRNAQLLIHDKGGLGFKALYAKAGLPEKFFAACRLLLETVAEMQRAGPKTTDADALVTRLLAKSAGQNIENLSYLIALIRQNG